MPVAHADSDIRRTYVLDTSVLLSDPRALLRFDEHDVVIPVVVVTELEAKRSHPELGYFARQALRLLDDLRVENGRLSIPWPARCLGQRVEMYVSAQPNFAICTAVNSQLLTPDRTTLGADLIFQCR